MTINHRFVSDGAWIEKEGEGLKVKMDFIPFGGSPTAYVGGEYHLNGKYVQVTGRELGEYRNLLQADLQSKGQYTEIGPGLGAAIPLLAERAENGEIPPPIAIDAVNYPLLRDLLYYGVELSEHENFSDQTRIRVRELFMRSRVLLENPHVRLINKPLGQAMKDHPELLGSSDHLIELYGPSFYASTETKTPIQVRESALDLLKKGGKYQRRYSQ